MRPIPDLQDDLLTCGAVFISLTFTAQRMAGRDEDVAVIDVILRCIVRDDTISNIVQSKGPIVTPNWGKKGFLAESRQNTTTACTNTGLQEATHYSSQLTLAEGPGHSPLVHTSLLHRSSSPPTIATKKPATTSSYTSSQRGRNMYLKVAALSYAELCSRQGARSTTPELCEALLE